MASPLDVVDRLAAKAKWAKKHIEELETSLSDFVGPPHTASEFIRFEDDHNTRERSYYCVRVPEVPIDFPVIVGDALQNMRSALDHLACHLVSVGGGMVQTRTSFPIARSMEEYTSANFRRKIEGMRPEAANTIDGFQPYKGGNFLLWELHELNRIDKHRLLLTVCAAHRGQSMTPTERASMEKIFRDSHPGIQVPDLRHVVRESPATVPLKVGQKFHSVPHAELEPQTKFLIDVAFDEPEIVKCEPIIPLLHNMASLVLAVILGFDRDGLL